MVVRCERCGRFYDDARRWTICPHRPLDEAPTDSELQITPATFVIESLPPGLEVERAWIDGELSVDRYILPLTEAEVERLVDGIGPRRFLLQLLERFEYP